MQFFYLVTAMTLSIGVNMFAGANMQNETAAKVSENRAVAFEEQAKIYARAVRRDVRLNPSSYRANRGGPVGISNSAHNRAEFGGYQMAGRFQVSLAPNGDIITQLTDAALNGPNGLGQTGDIVAETVLDPVRQGVGGLNLSSVGVRVSGN